MPETSVLHPPETCWRIEQADDFSIVIDADLYFATARAAMKQAKRCIYLIGWDFDARIVLGRPDLKDEAPARIGDFLLWLAKQNPDLEIRLLLWNPVFFATWTKGWNAYYLMRWKLHPQITVLLDGQHPLGSSHHQKILVIDDSVAFCGGIDVTNDRWDTREHLDQDPLRRRPGGAAYGPWHDISSVCTGPAAQALGDLCRVRWQQAGGPVLPPVETRTDIRLPDGAFSFGKVALAIARSSPPFKDRSAVTEIEKLYIAMIEAANHVIYAESQYFASRAVAQVLAKRLTEKDGPEIVLINPFKADNWLGSVAMDTARARLYESLRRQDLYGRFRIYHPVTSGGTPIYVHSKLMIIDDKLMRVGSSNFNNRSMRYDNECDVAFDAAQDETGALSGRLADLRDDLLAEHLGVTPEAINDAVQATGSLITAIENLRDDRTIGAAGLTVTLVPYETPRVNDLEKWLADNEILDPEGPGAVLEPIEKRGLFRGRLQRPGRRKA
ncbi:phospholipase D-like domain-containing protein [Pararhizobium sp.]|uniref:phospholipase D-like domain-containing protein n=1 Tax=Pararhizobium sp. TaxID=1977563 RepID=UPI002725D2DB|nr:phospholipase D-like domain-containing protein [Pararhizobium sp.]MDO9416972.1 phospholipase D-like domain-containing protein [Pararhizobium sp.]